jgi:dynein heavy chain
MPEGIGAGEALSIKIVTMYDLCKRQLSKQDHYDFGLLAIKSVLSMAGSLKRETTGISDEMIILLAMNNMNIPKLVNEDIPLFNSIINDLFPGLELEAANNGEIEHAISSSLQNFKYQFEPNLVAKIIQLRETMLTRHGNMLVGRTGSGKTTVYKTLVDTLNRMIIPTQTFSLNPKVLSLGELYGEYDLNTLQWSEGVLSTVIREVSTMESDDFRWVIFDDPVNTLWIESMNSVLDDNKVLTLINSSRISLPPEVSLLFEVEDLAVASPATVSRCGMIYFETAALGYKPYLNSWMARTITNERHKNRFTSLTHKYLEVMIDFKHQSLHDLIPCSDLNVITFILSTLSNSRSSRREADLWLEPKTHRFVL